MKILILSLCVLLVVIYILLPKIYAIRGSIAYEKSGLENALKFYEKAYKTKRASVRDKITYALLVLRDGRPEDSEKLFNELVLSPKMPEKNKNAAKQYRCMAYIKEGRCAEAAESAAELLESYKNSDLYAILGYAMLLLGKDGALELCAEAYDYNEDNRDIADNYALALIKNGESERALEICDKVIQKNRYFPEGHFHKAMALKNLGRFHEALEELELLDDCDFKYLTTIGDDEIDALREEIENA